MIHEPYMMPLIAPTNHKAKKTKQNITEHRRGEASDESSVMPYPQPHSLQSSLISHVSTPLKS